MNSSYLLLGLALPVTWRRSLESVQLYMMKSSKTHTLHLLRIDSSRS
jgi:hypothetical protein